MKVHKNTFEGGLDTNTSKNLISPNKYIDAQNLNIAASNNFFALENIRGTTNVQNIVASANVTVLGVFTSNYKIGTTSDVPCLTIITATNGGASSTYKIWVYATTTDTLYELYQETFDGTNYFTNDRTIDAVLYPEATIDILYFTDHFFEIRKLRCEIPVSYSANFLTSLDLKLLQHGANGIVSLSTILNGEGSLFCGSYQFAYQLVNPSTNQYTKFSLFTDPIQIYLKSPDSNNNIRSGVGLQSDKQILLDITPSAEELAYYTHFRLAVIENIEPSGVDVEIARLTQLEEIADFLSGSIITSVIYSTNVRLESIQLSDIVVDKLAVDTIKTLAIRENRLVAGNVTYKDLSYNNGNPAISSGSVLKQSGFTTYDNMFSDAYLSSVYRGYFRDEVYRFAISYFDEDGNFSFPSVLDLSSVTHNQITGDFKDMKFPSRSQYIGATNYTLFKNSDGVQSLGLRLVGLNNHPTWAKGFVILRAKRLKRILFQTPVVPLNKIYAIGALEDYPITAVELSGTTTRTNTYDSAQPMGPFTTYTPRDYFRLNPVDIDLYSVSGGSTGTNSNQKFTGEAYLNKQTDYSLAMIFPPEFLYENKSFTFSPAYKLEPVDAALLRTKFTDFSDLSIGSATRGRNIKTSVSGTFHALRDSQYYYDSTHTGGKTSLSSAVGLNAYEEFSNLSTGSVVGGFNIFKYDKLETPTISWGSKAMVQKCGVVKLDSSKSEINSDGARTFVAGTQPVRPASATQDFYLTDDTFTQTIEIANITSDLGDSRYGVYSTPHDFIFTGTIVTFSELELATVEAGGSLPKTVDVWGGDCYVSPHLFKLTDTTYGVTNSEKFESAGLSVLDATRNWERAFSDIASGTDCALSIPVPYKNAAQYIQVILESEYNSGVIDNEVLNVVTTSGGLPVKMPVYGLNDSSESSCRIPLTYQLNHNHKKQNSDKIFSIKDPLLSDNLTFGSRFLYSDQKVYQTSINGFDIFRVLNFKDLEETYGDIHKLVIVGNDLYSLQERAVTYIGIGERTLETTDALTLAVQSGSFIGNIIVIDSNRGTQHLKSVFSTGNSAYFVDNRNQTVNRLAGRQIDIISEPSVASTFRTSLETALPEKDLITIFDPVLKQLWFVYNGSSNQFCYLFDEARNIWVGNYQFSASSLFGGGYINQKLYLIGKESSNIVVGEMYTGVRSSLFGNSTFPSIQVVANPDMEIGKVFEDLLIPSSDRLYSFDYVVNREGLLGDQASVNNSLNISSRGEGNFRAKVLRDNAGARLRGSYAKIKLYWEPGTSTASYLPSILTKYRLSENRF